MKDTSRPKFVGRLATAAALGWLVPWALLARETQAAKKAKVKTKKKRKGA